MDYFPGALSHRQLDVLRNMVAHGAGRSANVIYDWYRTTDNESYAVPERQPVCNAEMLVSACTTPPRLIGYRDWTEWTLHDHLERLRRATREQAYGQTMKDLRTILAVPPGYNICSWAQRLMNREK